MDYDLNIRLTRSGRVIQELSVLPDADISDPEMDSDDDQRFSSVVESTVELTSEDEGTQTFGKAECRRNKKRMPPIDVRFKETASGSSCVLREPVEYFRHYFNSLFMKLIVEQSHITESELETFLGMLLKMGLVPMRRYYMYWSTELRCDAIAEAMSRNSAGKRRSMIGGKLSRPWRGPFSVVEVIMRYVLDRESPKEEIIPYKGKIQQKLYLLRKLKKWGIKVNERTGVSGFLYDFCFYEGKLQKVKKPSGCFSYDVVMKLCETVPKHGNFKIFFDNYFTPLELQLRLLKKGIHTIGTIRQNRSRNAPLKTEQELENVGRGAFHVCTTAENN
ncbi:PiggyBac transposable element-derived protein 2 [Trichinella papuae]|uniref:PiggyBac transposable element-derived protein 2 n=1 Tax=Trichinella papuae TaxID=268474 RepID=A0A0V1MUR5_9BILA|nr:PiggyBac transposable element-derived protein 2 [Trichinella papuae]